MSVLLGIESSCDETAAAVVEHGRVVRSSVVLSQVPLHRPYHGVVPEIASRSHVENLPGMVEAALAEAGIDWDGLDGIAVTRGPGHFIAHHASKAWFKDVKSLNSSRQQNTVGKRKDRDRSAQL